MKTPVSDNIRQIRELKGFTQEYVAAKLGITQQAYSQGEKNPDRMTLKRLKLLSKILDVELITLLGEDQMFIQQNYNQHGGHAAAKMIVPGLSESEKAFLTLIIEDQRNTISLLKELLHKNNGS